MQLRSDDETGTVFGKMKPMSQTLGQGEVVVDGGGIVQKAGTVDRCPMPFDLIHNHKQLLAELDNSCDLSVPARAPLSEISPG